eukprot:COSAG02_NODE_1376_length_12993_cov_56.849542_2_plen_79_part_00
MLGIVELPHRDQPIMQSMLDPHAVAREIDRVDRVWRAHRIHSVSESTRAAWRAVRACGTQCMVLMQGFRIYLEHLEVR